MIFLNIKADKRHRSIFGVVADLVAIEKDLSASVQLNLFPPHREIFLLLMRSDQGVYHRRAVEIPTTKDVRAFVVEDEDITRATTSGNTFS